MVATREIGPKGPTQRKKGDILNLRRLAHPFKEWGKNFCIMLVDIPVSTLGEAKQYQG